MPGSTWRIEYARERPAARGRALHARTDTPTCTDAYAAGRLAASASWAPVDNWPSPRPHEGVEWYRPNKWGRAAQTAGPVATKDAPSPRPARYPCPSPHRLSIRVTRPKGAVMATPPND